MSTFLSDHKRSHRNGELRASDIGSEVILTGWVWNRRDHGGCVFIDLRDRDGVTQVVFDKDISESAHTLAGELRGEYCIGVVGEVISRGENSNSKMPTGAIEVMASRLEIFSRSETTPFEIENKIDTNEALRLKHRYLDLRRPSMQERFILRSKMVQSIRQNLADKHAFLELETPFMLKYTPGGARNFLVPARLHPGSFYALAESPQIFKQLFMVSGFDRYFQIVRCFRDEDLRNDRQPEFTQVDLEMSFVQESDVQEVIEDVLSKAWKDVLGVDIPTPFLRMPYDEAMDRFGCDKPDLRLELELKDVTEAAEGSGFKIFDGAIAKGAIVKGMRVPEGERLSRSALDGLTDFGKPYGAKGVAYARVQADGTWQAPFAKAFSDEARERVNKSLAAQTGDVLLFVADKHKIANAAMSAIRLHVGKRLDMIKKDQWKFLWVTEMPLFEEQDDGTFMAAHHPFTSPRSEDVDRLKSDPGACRARAYDCVLNGNEIGGGSIRIHQADVQAKLFSALGLSDEEAQAKFGFLLEAFKYGPPPHGGIALGLDRLAMLATHAESLRDVIAYPKTQKGTDLMTEAPSPVLSSQLDELHIQVKPGVQNQEKK